MHEQAANLEIAGPSSALTPKAASNITELIHFYAPEFTSVLLRQLTGECARSDIDALCDPLRKYIMSHSLLAKRQLESVMAEGTNLHEKVQLGVPVAERTIFVKQIMGYVVYLTCRMSGRDSLMLSTVQTSRSEKDQQYCPRFLDPVPWQRLRLYYMTNPAQYLSLSWVDV